MTIKDTTEKILDSYGEVEVDDIIIYNTNLAQKLKLPNDINQLSQIERNHRAQKLATTLYLTNMETCPKNYVDVIATAIEHTPKLLGRLKKYLPADAKVTEVDSSDEMLVQSALVAMVNNICSHKR